MSIKLNSSGGGSITVSEPSTAVDLSVTFVAANGNISPFISGTAQATTNTATSYDFTGIPSWVKRITVMHRGVGVNAAFNTMIQLGTSSGVETTGYISTLGAINAGVAAQTNATNGFLTASMNTTRTATGTATITLLDSNVWVYSSILKSETTVISYGAGEKSLSGTLDRVRVTTTSGTAGFNAGSVNILYE